MKKLLAFLFVIALVFAAAAGAVIWYVKPSQRLDLTYSKLSIPDKILEMVQRRSMEVRLTEDDLNQLVKASLASQSTLPHNIRLTGASSSQHNDLLTVNANILWNERIEVGTTLAYRMSYQEPNLVLTRESIHIKDFTVPPGWLQTPTELHYNLHEKLPKLVGIQGIAFDPSDLRIALKLQLR